VLTWCNIEWHVNVLFTTGSVCEIMLQKQYWYVQIQWENCKLWKWISSTPKPNLNIFSKLRIFAIHLTSLIITIVSLIYIAQDCKTTNALCWKVIWVYDVRNIRLSEKKCLQLPSEYLSHDHSTGGTVQCWWIIGNKAPVTTWRPGAWIYQLTSVGGMQMNLDCVHHHRLAVVGQICWHHTVMQLPWIWSAVNQEASEDLVILAWCGCRNEKSGGIWRDCSLLISLSLKTTNSWLQELQETIYKTICPTYAYK